MHARVIFCRVGGLLETLLVVYILTKGKKSINAEKNENVELPHTQIFFFSIRVLCGRGHTVCQNTNYRSKLITSLK